MKNRFKGIKVWELSLLLALCICLCETAAEASRQEEISEKVLRFHVVAASDSEADQSLKLLVRDAVAEELEGLLREAETVEEAESLVEEHREALLTAARRAAGREKLELRLGKERYTYREAEGYALPAGEYSSLRLIIGEGKGHNWWGVIFPALDLSGGCAEAAEYLGEEELRLIMDEEGVELRFRVLELLQKLRVWLRGPGSR